MQTAIADRHRAELLNIMEHRGWTRSGLSRAAEVSRKALSGFLNQTQGFDNPSLRWLDRVFDAARREKPSHWQP